MLDYNSVLGGTVGCITGVGPGRGIRLMFIIADVFNVLTLVAGALRVEYNSAC
jgi:hypothetical protein